MTTLAKDLLHGCLYFTANSLARTVTKMAEEEFSKIGFSPSTGFILLLVSEQPGISQKELAEYMDLAQSTISRFTDTLISKGMVEKNSQGRNILIVPTKAGMEKKELIQEVWKNLYRRYSKIIGIKEGNDLTASINRCCMAFQEEE